MNEGLRDPAEAVSNAEDLLGLVRQTPCSCAGLAQLIPKIPLDPLIIRTSLSMALAHAEGVTASFVALAAMRAGIPVSAQELIPLLPLVPDIRWMALLMGPARGDRVLALLEAIRTGHLTCEREAFALLIAVDLLGDRNPPERMLTEFRRLARSQLSPSAALVLAVAAGFVPDEAIRETVAHRSPLAGGPIGANVWHEVKRMLIGPAEEVLTEPDATADGTGTAADSRKVRLGRNDPCPCGSGKKYKKCCESSSTHPSPAPRRPTVGQVEALEDAAPGRGVEDMSIRQILRLDLESLGTVELIQVVRILASYSRWEEAELALSHLETRSDLPPDADLDDYREDLLTDALQVRALDVARRNYAKIRDEIIREEHGLEMALIDSGCPTLELVERHARRALRNSNLGELVDLADLLLRNRPALGLLLARACLLEADPLDWELLLEAMESVRFDLGIEPRDPYARLIDSRRDEGRIRKDEKVESLSRELHQLREQLRGASERHDQLVRELEEKEQVLADRPPGFAATGASAAPGGSERDEVRQALRTKVGQLQERISEFQEERASLRRELRSLQSQRRTSARSLAREEDGGPDPGTDCEIDAPAPGRPRILMPQFARRAQEAILAAPGNVGAMALRACGNLGAGEESAWKRVMRIKGRDDLWSFRVGIHYRLLFRFVDSAPSIEFVHLVSREDLVTSLRQL